METYPHLSQSIEGTLRDINATAGQFQAYDKTAKTKIDRDLENYVICSRDALRIGAVVIGETGSGKSATANTILGNCGAEKFAEGSSAVPITAKAEETSVRLDGFHLTVVDTPGSWETDHLSGKEDFVVVHIIVINLASPRFDSNSLSKLRSLQSADGNNIVQSGHFVVALTHADSALQSKSLEGYVQEIQGDPLHTFLTEDAKGKVIAINNAAKTEYQRNAHRQALLSRVVLASMPQQKDDSWTSWLSWLPSLWTSMTSMFSPEASTPSLEQSHHDDGDESSRPHKRDVSQDFEIVPKDSEVPTDRM